MIDGKSVLAIIPARGGSKGVPRKNIILIKGKPLIGWTIESAKQSKYIDRLILTSDDQEIIGITRHLGCEVPFVRPSHLAKDDTPGIDPVLHAMAEVPGYDIIVLLQPTSPLRTGVDIDQCIETLLSTVNAKSCVAVCEVSESPYWSFTLEQDASLLKPLLPDLGQYSRRQDLPKVFIPNGAVYVSDSTALAASKSFFTEKTCGYIMPRDRSVDIDTLEDLALVESILSHHR